MIEQHQAVNLEQQGMLAKLLAKENVRVQHGNYTTAYFDVKHRVLSLPLWQNKGKNVYDLLCGHEVGHALYTPTNGHARFHDALPGVPFSICNIIEDIRIERMVQDTYPGLSSTFRAAYAQFVADDFFGIKGKDLASLNVADRLNIHAKTRGAVQVPLTPSELAIYDKAMAAQTFGDVLRVCKELAELVGKQSQQLKQPAPSSKPDADASQQPTADQSSESDSSNDKAAESDSDNESTESDSGDEAETIRTTSTPQAESDQSEEVDGNNSTAGQSDVQQTYGDLISELTSQTEQALQQAVKDMTIDDGNRHFSMPSAKTIESTIIPFSEVMAERAKRPNYASYMADAGVQAEVTKLRAKAKKYVATLANEFNMRKAAYQYSRATVSSTGIINVNRLHSYKYADDIFKSATRLADAKNHGMMFFVDYSASMQFVLGTVLEHTVNLVMFCRSLNIPFQVFGFTNPNEGSKPSIRAAQAHGEIVIDNLQMVEIFSSKMSKAEFDLAVSETLAHVAWREGTRIDSIPYNPNDYHCPVTSKHELLNGTPLLEAIVAAHVLIRQFRQANPVQKVNVLFLTDGDGNGLNYAYDSVIAGKLGQKPSMYSKSTGIINGRRIDLTYGFSGNYEKLIKSLRETCDCTVTCFFVPELEGKAMKKAYEAVSTLKRNASSETNELPENLKKAYRKDHLLEIRGGFGFDAYYVLGTPSDLAIVDDESFDPEFDSDAKVTTSKMARAFTEFNSVKRNSRVLLNKFATQIA
jgi:hypothetical protein